jgi:hypothetical protein
VKKWLLALAAALLSAPCTLAAQGAANQGSDPHERVYEVLQAGIDDTVVLERGLEQIRANFAPMPQFVELERLHPGALDTIIALMRPIMREHSDRVEAEYRPRMIALLRSGLSRAEAIEVGEFYTSPLGRKVLAASSANMRSSSVVEAAVRDEEVSSADIQSDMQATGNAVLGSLSRAERDQVYREIAARPGLAKLAPLVSRLAALRAEMESERFNDEEQARFDAALEAAFAPRD